MASGSDERLQMLANPLREVVIDELNADELPQPIFSHSGTPSVKCKVCQNLIDLEGKLDCYVVKCNHCHEATPIKAPPIGKKYVRCQCQCLLICKAGSKRVACPRENCKLIVILEASNENQSLTSAIPLRVTCGHCGQPFLFSASAKRLARCPHCKKISSIKPKHERKLSIIFFSLGLLFLVASCLLLGLTVHQVQIKKGLYAAYAILFIISIAMFGRAAHYSCIRVSQVESAGHPYTA